jgi:hypothetical protein
MEDRDPVSIKFVLNLEKTTDSITVRIGRPNSRAYWGYYPHTAISIDCTRERVVVRVNPARERSDQSDQEDDTSTNILTPEDKNAGVTAGSHQEVLQ